MHDQVSSPASRDGLGKGVFKPSRAAIAREMECRLKLGSPGAKQRRPDPTASRH